VTPVDADKTMRGAAVLLTVMVMVRCARRYRTHTSTACNAAINICRRGRDGMFARS
jgi:hypothetical protein